MLEVIPHGDVTELRFSSWRSRSINYAVRAFVVRGVLVDTLAPDARAELATWLESTTLEGAIVTHGHEDHGGNADLLAERGIPLLAAPDTAAILRAPGRIGFYRRYAWGPARPFRGQMQPFADPALTLEPARGHSADHHVVWDAERGTLYGGDLFVGVKVRIVHHDEDLRVQIPVLRALAARDPARLFDAHRGLIERPAAVLRAKADWMEETIAKVERRIADGWSDARIRDEVLGGEEMTGYASFGEYSRLNFVRHVRATMTTPSRPAGDAPTAERPGAA